MTYTVSDHMVAAGDVVIDRPAGTAKSYYFKSAGSSRWTFSSTSTAESGANVGSDFVVGRYGDNGVWISDPLKIVRSTGEVQVAGDPTTALGVATKQYVDASGGGGMDQATADARYVNVTGDQMSGDLIVEKSGGARVKSVSTDAESFVVIGSPVGQQAGFAVGIGQYGMRWQFYRTADPESGGNAGSNFGLARYSDAGAFIDNIWFVNRASGLMTIGTLETYQHTVTRATLDMDTDAAGTWYPIRFRKSGVTLWEMGIGGSGARFDLDRYNTSGVYQDTPLSINASNGEVTFKKNVIANGSLAVDADGAYVSITSPTPAERFVTFRTDWEARWTFGANSEAESTGNLGSNFTIGRYDDNGAWVDNPISITRNDGVVNIKNPLWLADPVPTSANNATSKQYVDARTPKITVSTTAPSSPAVGEIWIDTN